MRVRWPPPMVAGMTTDTSHLDPFANSRLWARVFAAIYDPSMDACGFQLKARPARWRAMPPIIRPLAIGRATIAATRGQEA